MIKYLYFDFNAFTKHGVNKYKGNNIATYQAPL